MSVTYKRTEVKLKDYLTGKIDTQIKRRKEILKYPPKPSIKKKNVYEVDIRTSGGKKDHDKIGSEVAKVLDDRKYNQLLSDQYTIVRFMIYVHRYDKQAHEILHLFYGENKSWAAISEKVCLSETSCKDKRKKYVEELSEWLIIV